MHSSLYSQNIISVANEILLKGVLSLIFFSNPLSFLLFHKSCFLLLHTAHFNKSIICTLLVFVTFGFLLSSLYNLSNIAAWPNNYNRLYTIPYTVPYFSFEFWTMSFILFIIHVLLICSFQCHFVEWIILCLITD